MKKTYLVTYRTKAEYNSGTTPATVAPANYTTFAAAKAAAKAELAGAGPPVSFAEIYGPQGLVFRITNPAGA